MLVVQSFIYYQTYKNDKKWVRYLVRCFGCTKEGVTKIPINTGPVHAIGALTSKGKDSSVPIRDGLSIHCCLTSIFDETCFIQVFISTPIQLFFAWRIRIISQSKVLTVIISFFSLSSFIGGIAAPIATKVTDSTSYDRLPRIAPTIITWLTSAATTDIIIAVSLVYHLYRMKTGVRSTDDLVNRIMRLTIQTGMITALFATLDVVCFNAFPKASM
ncbi:hypothetical protein EYR36_010488 [Pleurotus pulmonarius]|nr:hypothetical protein EYR36_010488 [Pleurotus pulmonarius]